ncbi:MAG: hypothetical protein NVSMB26_25730 [Beijerinckiaceae bacterium]
MADEPENLVLRRLDEVRRGQIAALESQERVMSHLSTFAKNLDRLATEFETFKVETRQTLREMQLSAISSDNASLNRHNDLLKVLARIEELESKYSA